MNDTVLDRLFSQAREVVLGERDEIDISLDDIMALVSNEVLQARFRARFRLEAQNQETRELILILLSSISTEAIETSEQIAIDADGVDHYVGRPSIGVSAGAVAMLVASTGLGAILLLCSGVAGLIVGGVGSNILKKRANRLKAFGSRLHTLIEDLKNG